MYNFDNLKQLLAFDIGDEMMRQWNVIWIDDGHETAGISALYKQERICYEAMLKQRHTMTDTRASTGAYNSRPTWADRS
jgi:hypothetical protein